MNIIQTNLVNSEARIAIVISRFNHFINIRLLDGSIDTIKRIGQVKDENITVIWVPGAYELPLITKIVAKANKYDAIIALGTIIRGNTTHFKYIASSITAGLLEVIHKYEMPISFGILITNNIEQAIERAGSKSGNKGIEAALAVLEMINLLKEIRIL